VEVGDQHLRWIIGERASEKPNRGQRELQSETCRKI
jgi:hypothetical protein